MATETSGNTPSKTFIQQQLENFQARYPDLYEKLNTLGVDSDQLLVAAMTSPNASITSTLLTEKLTGAIVGELWTRYILSNSEGDLLSLLLLEWNLSRMPASVSASMTRFKYAKSIHVCRTRTAIAIHDYAREVNWKRPVVFVRLLKLGRKYLRYCVQASEMTHPGSRKEFTGRLGVATILINRFELVSRRDLVEAIESLKKSIEENNDPIYASSYLIEAYIALHDLTGDPTPLSDAVAVASREYTTNPPSDLIFAKIMLQFRIFSAAISPDLKTQALKLIEGLLAQESSLNTWNDKDSRVRRILTKCLLQECQKFIRVGITLDTRNVDFPFGIRRFGAEVPNTWRLILDSAASRLEKNTGLRDNALARAIRAEMLSHRASIELSVGRPESRKIAISSLEEAVSIVRDTDDDRSRLERARNMLLLARETSDSSIRRQAHRVLIKENSRDPGSPLPLIILAKDVARNGSLHLKETGKIAEAVRSGDTSALFLHSARLAVKNPDLRIRNLGGRGATFTIDDYSGISSEFLVFKETPANCLGLEIESSRIISARIERLPETEQVKYAVARILSPSREEASESVGSVLSIREFSAGQTLYDWVIKAREDRLSEELIDTIIGKTAVYLALINCSLPPINTAKISRNELKKKELRRWLRDGWNCEDSLDIFNSWWNILIEAPELPRRDAHALNWLVGPGYSITAVDLDASGCRPVGYDLAQLTDDLALVPPDDWSRREKIVDLYCDALEEFGVSVVREKLLKWYKAAVLARAVRGLTSPAVSSRIRRHCELVLDCLQNDDDQEIARVARSINHAYYKYLGADSAVDITLSDRNRRSLSKAIAYNLRHNGSVVDNGGWAEASTLLSAINNQRSAEKHVSIIHVLRTVTHPEEPRFEISAGKVRARYGHSVPVALSAMPSRPTEPLFHATSMPSISSIIDAGEGLKPMDRIGVHFSNDPVLAIETAKRHGTPVLLEVLPSSPRKLCKASETTWIAEHVRVNGIRIVPVWAEPGSA